MEPVAAFTVLSALGAAFFATGGYFFSQSRRSASSEGAAPRDGEEHARSRELADARNEIEAARAALAEAERRADGSTKRLAEAEQRAHALEAKVHEVEGRARDAEQQAAQKLAEAERLEKAARAALDDAEAQKTLVRAPIAERRDDTQAQKTIVRPPVVTAPLGPTRDELEKVKAERQQALERATRAEKERDALRRLQADADAGTKLLAEAHEKVRELEASSGDAQRRVRIAEKLAKDTAKLANDHAARAQELEKTVERLHAELEGQQAHKTIVRPPLAVAPLADVGPAREELEALRRDRQEALTRASRADEERDALRRRYADLDAERLRSNEAAEEARAQARHTEEQLAALTKRLAAVQSDAEEGSSRARRAEEGFASASEELVSLRQTAANAAQELAVEREQLKAARTRAEELAAEVTRLRESDVEAATLRKEHAELVERNRVLSAQQFASAPKSNASTLDISNDTMKSLIDRVQELKHVRSVAIADALGFAVVGSGEHIDALAAFGAFIVNMGERAVALLPVEAAAQVSVRDANGVTCTVRALPGSELALVTLGVGDEPTLDVDRIINETPSLTN